MNVSNKDKSLQTCIDFCLVSSQMEHKIEFNPTGLRLTDSIFKCFGHSICARALLSFSEFYSLMGYFCNYCKTAIIQN